MTQQLSAFARHNLTDSTLLLADVQIGLVNDTMTNGSLDLDVSKIAPRAPPPSGGEAMTIMIDRGRRGARRARCAEAPRGARRRWQPIRRRAVRRDDAAV